MQISNSNESTDQQNLINSYFDDAAGYWADIYQRMGVKEFVHQERLRLMLELVDGIGLPAGARVLDAGCGAGFAAVALAKRSYLVEAMDAAQAMVDSTSRRAMKAGFDGQVTTSLGSVDSIPFADETFSLVVVMGVLPWLPSIEKPLRELRRVLAPTGHLIVSVDNRWSLCRFLDPLTNPLLSPAKELARSVLYRFGRSSPGIRSHLTSGRKFEALLRTTGFEKVEALTLGFGPFSVFRHELLSYSAGLKVHQALQRIAEHGFAPLRSAGMQSIVVARRGRTFHPEQIQSTRPPCASTPAN
jgi:ubiquinone/menaquinone biosynthesis C-methylase UbiE